MPVRMSVRVSKVEDRSMIISMKHGVMLGYFSFFHFINLYGRGLVESKRIKVYYNLVKTKINAFGFYTKQTVYCLYA